MSKRLISVWWGIILLEILSIGFIGYRYYRVTRGDGPKKVSVMPINKDYIQYPKDTMLQYYDEPKSNIQVEQDLSVIGIAKKIIQTFNADGLNERFDYSVKKPKGVYRIISLGDSFTQGAFVATEKNYSEVLEDMLNTMGPCGGIDRFEVINLGVLGYDMQYNLERFKRKGLKYNPDSVILWTNDNDYLEPSELLRKFATEWIPTTQSPEAVEKYKTLGDHYPELTALIDKFYETHPRNELILQEVNYLQELISLYSGPFIIFTVASLSDNIHLQIKSVIEKKSSVHFFPEIPDDFDKFSDLHPSDIGHRQFATFLYDKLIKSKIISCE